MVFKVLDPPLPPDKGGTCIKDSASKPPPLDGTNSIPPKTKRKFDVGCTLCTKEEGPKRKIHRAEKTRISLLRAFYYRRWWYSLILSWYSPWKRKVTKRDTSILL